MLSHPISLSPPFCARYSKRLITSVDLYWTHSSMFVSLLYWELRTGPSTTDVSHQDCAERNHVLPRPAGNALWPDALRTSCCQLNHRTVRVGRDLSCFEMGRGFAIPQSHLKNNLFHLKLCLAMEPNTNKIVLQF